jgi:hypothetical protein
MGKLTARQEYGQGTREEFLSNCQSGKYDDVVVIYRSNDSTSVRIHVQCLSSPDLPSR